MSSPSRVPAPAPKPKPKPRVPQKPESEDALKDKVPSEQNGASNADSHSSPVVPAPRPRTGTQVLPTQDGGSLAPQVRPRVGTNPVTLQERSPKQQHRRTASDAKGEEGWESHSDPPWGKKPRPLAPKKPLLPPSSSLADTSHKSHVSGGEASNSPTPLRDRVQSRSVTTSPTHLRSTSAYQRPKSSSTLEMQAKDADGVGSGESVAATKKSASSEVSGTPVKQSSLDAGHGVDSIEGGGVVGKKPRPPRPPPYAAPKQVQQEKERKVSGDEIDGGGGGGGKEQVQKTGDMHLPIAGTHDTAKGEEPASPTPLSPAAKPSTVERAKLPEKVKSPIHPAPPPRPHPAPPHPVTKHTAEKVAADMEFFTIELLKAASSAPAGMIVKVKPIPTLPEFKEEITGPVIEKILPRGAADNDGRPKVGDLVAEANGHSLLGCSQQEALQRINEPGKTVRLKLGRSLAATTHLPAPPQATEDLTVVADVDHVPATTTSHSGDEAAEARIEKLLMEQAKLEGERDNAVDQLAQFKKEMQAIIDEKEQTTTEALNKSSAAQEKLSSELNVLQKQMADLVKEEEEEHEKVAKAMEDKNVEIASLSSQVASLHKQLDSQREASNELKEQLSSVASAGKRERDRGEGEREAESTKELEDELQKLQVEVSSMSAQCVEKDKRITDLKGGLSEALPKLLEAEKHIATLKEDLKTKGERITTLESEVMLKKETEEALKQGKEEAQRKWEEEKERRQSLEGPAKVDPKFVELQGRVEELQKELESSRTHATEVEERCHCLEETLTALKKEKEGEKEREREKEEPREREEEDGSKLQKATPLQSPVAKPRVPRQDSKPVEDEVEEGEGSEKLPPKPTPKPRPRKKVQVEPSRSEEGKAERDGSDSKVDQGTEGKVALKGTLEDSGEWVMVEEEEKDGEEEQEVAPNFDDFDAVSEHTAHVSSNVLKEKVRMGRKRPRKAPSREHLKKISAGDIGEDLPSVQLIVLEDDDHEKRHTQQLSGGTPGPAPPLVMPKPPREVKRAKSADNLLGDGDHTPTTPLRVPGGVHLVPVFPGIPPLKKSLSGNSLDTDTDGGRLVTETEQTDGTSSGKSSPSKSRPGSRPGSAKGVSGSVDSLDKLDGEGWSGSGMSLLTAPEWSCDQVAQWLHRVGLGKYTDGAREKSFTGKQLMELDSGKIKSLGMAKDDVALLKKEHKLLKRLHEKAKKDEKKRVEAEKKEAKKKKK